MLEYFIYLVEDEENHSDLFIKKVQTNNETEDEIEHLLQWSYNSENNNLDIFVDEILLYQIENGNSEEEKRNLIVSKIDKF